MQTDETPVECPDCGCRHAPVVEARLVPVREGRPAKARERHECRNCGKSFSRLVEVTEERVRHPVYVFIRTVLRSLGQLS